MLLALLLLLLSGPSSPDRVDLCPALAAQATMAAAEKAPPAHGAPVSGRTTLSPGLQRQVTSARHGRPSAMLAPRSARIAPAPACGEAAAEERFHASSFERAPVTGRGPPVLSAP